MKTEIKIIHTQYLVTKEGKPYKVVHAVITLGSAEFVRKFYIFISKD